MCSHIQHVYQYPVGQQQDRGVSEQSGQCCTLREQTAPELVMDPHCRAKPAQLQLRP